ncbi:hypothetical protein COC69_05710 [Bacillus cereus]|uniref:Gp28/Gp37-like domain-containing protein n=1 Tax=Bacillus cereus TaxID=1396 RepID=A0A9X7GX91_BACCE|nr:siphovirus ReqiPepy6 Gp37-like family protein [Bacillus cereus]PGS81626.1 hypothetical protein COC69_05710 [Bacillus cereus]
MFIDVFQRIQDFEFESVAILDGWNSLIIEENYYSCNTFELKIPLTKENVWNFQPENAFLFDGLFYYVDGISSDGKAITIRGKSLAGKFGGRVIDRIYIAKKSPSQIVYDHFNQEMIAPADYVDSTGSFSGVNRKVNYLSLAAVGDLGMVPIDYQTSYQQVQEQIEKLCKTYDFGFKEVAVDSAAPKNQIEIYKGRDLSNVIEISDDFENLVDVSYEHNNFDEMTTAYVYGEGDGAERAKVIVNPNLSGLERKELSIDARDLRSESDDPEAEPIPPAQYINMLIDRGNQKLAEQLSILTMNGEIELNSKLFKFKTDFDVGDRIKISSSLYQFSKVVTIVKARKTYDEKGEFVELVFDKETPTVFEILGRK